MYNAIVIVGPPGSGKGTQAKLLGEHEIFYHFSSGDMFRGLNPETDIGSRVRSLIDKGNFVPDKETFELFEETIERYVQEGSFMPESQYLVLDGIPRNINQIHILEQHAQIEDIIYLNTPYITCVRRILNRGKNQNRADDKSIFKILKRMGIYRTKTYPIVPFYRNEGKLIEVDGSGEIDQVHNQIKKILY